MLHDDSVFVSCPIECTPEIDLCLIIDVSSSIRDQNPPDGSVDYIEQSLEYLASLTTENMNIDLENTRVGIVCFGERAQLQFSLGTVADPGLLWDSLRELGSSNMGSGPSNPAQALTVAREQCFGNGGDRDDVRNVAFMITTGVGLSVSAMNSAVLEAQALRDSGVFLVTCGVTEGTDERFIHDLSSPPQEAGQTYFHNFRSQPLEKVKDSLVLASCGRSSESELLMLKLVTCFAFVLFLNEFSGFFIFPNFSTYRRL